MAVKICKQISHTWQEQIQALHGNGCGGQLVFIAYPVQMFYVSMFINLPFLYNRKYNVWNAAMV